MHKEERLLRIGVIGAGPIAQVAHLDACRRARNVELFAVCDVARDLLERVKAVQQPHLIFTNLDEMLETPEVEAVIVATSDAFHVPLAQKAVAAGKHVFIEKPLGVTIEECEEFGRSVELAGVVAQVGFNYRFDPSLAAASRFITQELGAVTFCNAWYCDSIERYTMTDNLQPIVVRTEHARRPEPDPKSNKQKYFLATHGSHIFDTVRFLAGGVTAVRARYLERAGSYLWSIDVAFHDGSLGHITIVIPAAGDFESGIQLFGENGSVQGRVHLPWYRKSGTIECFSAKDGTYRRPLGADADTYKLQLEAFADTVLRAAPQTGASAVDGIENMRALVATAQSSKSDNWVELSTVSGSI